MDTKQLLQEELDKALATLIHLGDLKQAITAYEVELQSDIATMEILLKRTDDKKLSQINSALEFVRNDLQKYIKKETPTQIVLVKDEVEVQVESVTEMTLMKGTKINNEYLAGLVLQIMKKHPKTVYTGKEIEAHLVSQHPELKELWKNPSAAVNYVMSLTADNVQKVGKGQYMLQRVG